MFGQGQISWECQGFSARESQAAAGLQPLELLGEEGLRASFVSKLRLWLQQHNDHQDVGDTVDELLACWYPLVEDYSTRSLTYDSDVLLAIAGIAKVLAKSYHLSYSNGLWKEDLCAGLLWQAHKPQGVIEASTNPSFPSWTWIRHWGKKKLFS
jgi:hypothetical protein